MAEKRTAGGRPVEYGPAIYEEILDRISDGETLRSICSDPRLPSARWVAQKYVHDPEFKQQYISARQAGALILADEILDVARDDRDDWHIEEKDGQTIVVADAGHIARARLRVDSLKWLAGKQYPRLFGDREEKVIEQVEAPPMIDITALDDKEREALKQLVDARTAKRIVNGMKKGGR